MKKILNVIIIVLVVNQINFTKENNKIKEKPLTNKFKNGIIKL